MIEFIKLQLPTEFLTQVNIINVAANNLFEKKSYSEAGKYYDKISALFQNIFQSAELEKKFALLENFRRTKKKLKRADGSKPSSGIYKAESGELNAIREEYFLLETPEDIDVLRIRIEMHKKSLVCKQLSNEIAEALYTSSLLVDLTNKWSNILPDSLDHSLGNAETRKCGNLKIIKNAKIYQSDIVNIKLLEALDELHWCLDAHYKLVLLNENPKSKTASGPSKSELVHKRKMKTADLINKIKNNCRQ